MECQTLISGKNKKNISESCLLKFVLSIRIRIRIITGDMSNDIHSPGPVIWEVSP